MKLNIALLLSIFTLMLIGCGISESGNDVSGSTTSNFGGDLPKYEGKPGDLVIVMDEPYWSGKPGELVRLFFAKPIPPFFPEENIFNVSHVTKDKFGKFFKARANVLMCNINPESIEKSLFKLHSDVWAKDQQVLEIKSNSLKNFYDVVSKYGKGWAETLLEEEIARLQSNDAKHSNEGLSRLLKEHMGVSMVFPYGAIERKVSDSVVLIERNRKRVKGNRSTNVLQGFMIFREKYVDRDQFETDFRISKLNLMLKRYIRGAHENSYMEVVKDERFKPIVDVIDLNGYAFELTGRIGMVNDFKGGYFVCVSTVDPGSKDIITYFGYVHAPPFSKRDYLKEIKAIGYSMEF